MSNVWNPYTMALPQEYIDDLKSINGISADSRQVKSNTIFVAIKGGVYDGHNFIQEVIKKGAKILVVNENSKLPNVPINIKIIKSTETRLSYAYLCGEYYKPVPEKILFVTGTNGKTSTVEFCRQLLSINNIKSASLGTLGTIYNKKYFTNPSLAEIINSGLTTMDSKLLGQTLNELVNNNINVAVIEASSHGLSQFRLDGIKPISAGLTNIASDHLDFHDTWENYRDAKLQLFSRLLPENSWAVLPRNDINAELICNICNSRNINIINYGYNNCDMEKTDICCLGSKESVSGTIFNFKLRDTVFQAELPVWGSFQAENLMTAMGLAVTAGLNDKSIINSLKHCRSSEGRMQLIAYHKEGGRIFVDFAHTPDALQRVLSVAMNSLTGLLWLVFGCGGDRDKEKRPIMGAVAKHFANIIYVTDDNPRNEDPEIIRQSVLKGTAKNNIELNFNGIRKNANKKSNKVKIREFANREYAIENSIKSMSFNDTLIIAGKGHEKYQIIGNKAFPFDDCLIASECAGTAGWDISPYSDSIRMDKV